MGRPRVPLISRRGALEVALEIIDAGGVDGLSIRNLADRLNVSGASLYHHFENRQAIVLGAARLAFEQADTPRRDGEPWRAWMLRGARRLRQVLCDHPGLITALPPAPGVGLGIGLVRREETVAQLSAEDIPAGAIVPLLEALERYAVGSAPRDTVAGEPVVGSHLAEALARRAVGPDEVFELACEKIIDSVLAIAAERQPR